MNNNYGYNAPSYINPYARTNYGMPNYAQPQFSQQPQPQMAQMQNQPMQYELPIQYVGNGSLKEAEAYILFPNQKAMFIDKPNGMVYEKVCGVEGQSVITQYKKVDLESEEPNKIDMGEFAKKTDLNDFVKIEQYQSLQNQYNSLVEQVKNMQNKITGVKNNGGSKQQ